MVVEHNATQFEFRIHLPSARRVSLAGDFTRWDAGAIEMRRTADGWWCRTLTLPPGEYKFSYLVNGTEWVPDYAAGGIEPNRLGGWVSCLSVCRQQQMTPDDHPALHVSSAA